MRICLWIPVVVSAWLLVACDNGADEPARPTAVVQHGAEATAAPSATSTPARRFDPAVPPGVLVIDYGPREGWDSGGPGAGRGALVALDAATGAELDWWEPINTGHAGSGIPSPDGRSVAFIGSYDFILDPATGGRVDLRGKAGVLALPVWAADGQTFYGTYERHEPWSTPAKGGHQVLGTEFWAVDAATGEARQVVEAPFQVQALRVAASGGVLYALAFRSEQCCGIDIEGEPFVVAIDVETGEVSDEIPVPGVVVGQRFEERGAEGAKMNMLRTPGVALAPDASRLYIAHADDDRVTMVDLERMEVVASAAPQSKKSLMGRLGSWVSGLFVSEAKAKGGAYFVKEAAVSPDGRWLYITGSGAEICETDQYFPCVEWAPMGLRIIDTGSMEVVAEFEGIGHMLLTPDGERIVGWAMAYDYRGGGESADEVRYGPYVIDTATQQLLGVVDPPVGGWEIAVSPDGRYAYTVTQTLDHQSLLSVIDLERVEVVEERLYQARTLGLVGLAPRPTHFR